MFIYVQIIAEKLIIDVGSHPLAIMNQISNLCDLMTVEQEQKQESDL